MKLNHVDLKLFRLWLLPCQICYTHQWKIIYSIAAFTHSQHRLSSLACLFLSILILLFQSVGWLNYHPFTETLIASPERICTWAVTSSVPPSQNTSIALYKWVDGGIRILSQRHFKTQVETKMTPNKIDSNDSTFCSQSSPMSLRPSTGFASFGMVILGKAWEWNSGRLRWSVV